MDFVAFFWAEWGEAPEGWFAVRFGFLESYISHWKLTVQNYFKLIETRRVTVINRGLFVKCFNT